MQYYYFNLSKDKEYNFEKNLSVSSAIRETAGQVFKPFLNFLQNSIDVIKKKGEIKA